MATFFHSNLNQDLKRIQSSKVSIGTSVFDSCISINVTDAETLRSESYLYDEVSDRDSDLNILSGLLPQATII